MPRVHPLRRPVVALVAFVVLLMGGEAPRAARAGDVEWLHNLQDAEARAAVERAPVMIDFFADWCGWCKVLDRRTYTDPSVQQLTDRVIPVKVNTDLNPALSRLYQVGGLPTVVFVDAQGQEITRIVGYKDGPAFAAVLRGVLQSPADTGLLHAAALSAPTDAAQAYHLGDTLLSAALYDDAISVLTVLATRQSAQKEPGVLEDAGLDLAHAYYLNAQYAEAVTAYASFLHRYPKSSRAVEAQLYLAHAYASSGRGKDALVLYRKVKKAAPKAWQGHEAARAMELLAAAPGG